MGWIVYFEWNVEEAGVNDRLANLCMIECNYYALGIEFVWECINYYRPNMTSYREDADVRINNIQSRGIILKGDLVLVMFRRKKGHEYYVFPGGHMQEGETPLENAVREIYEETTIKVKNMDLAFEFKDYKKPKKTEEEHYFVGEWKSGEPTLSGEESRRSTEDNYYEPMWVKLSDLENLVVYTFAAAEWIEVSLEKFLKKRA